MLPTVGGPSQPWQSDYKWSSGKNVTIITSSNGNISALLAFYEGNTPITDGFSSQRPVTRSFNFFFHHAWTNGWTNNRDAADLRHHRAHYDVIVMGDNIMNYFQFYIFSIYQIPIIMSVLMPSIVLLQRRAAPETLILTNPPPRKL